MNGCKNKCYNVPFKSKSFLRKERENGVFCNATQHTSRLELNAMPLQRIANQAQVIQIKRNAMWREFLSLSRLSKTHNLWLVRSSLVDLTRFLAYFLAINFLTLLNSLNFSNFSTLFVRFSLFARRKFINFTRKFTNSRRFFVKFKKFTNFHFYGLPRLAFARLAMTSGRKFTNSITFSQIFTQNAFKILKNSTQRSKMVI